MINRRRFRRLYEQDYSRLMGAMIAMTQNRETAEEVTAAAFAAALEHLRSFRGASSFYTWLHAIGVNELRNWRRRNFNRGISLDAWDYEPFGRPDPFEQVLEREELSARVQAALAGIPSKYRRVMTDRFLSGLSTQETARRQRAPVGTVLSRVAKAKQILRKRWEAQDEA